MNVRYLILLFISIFVNINFLPYYLQNIFHIFITYTGSKAKDYFRQKNGGGGIHIDRNGFQMNSSELSVDSAG